MVFYEERYDLLIGMLNEGILSIQLHKDCDFVIYQINNIYFTLNS